MEILLYLYFNHILFNLKLAAGHIIKWYKPVKMFFLVHVKKSAGLFYIYYAIQMWVNQQPSFYLI